MLVGVSRSRKYEKKHAALAFLRGEGVSALQSHELLVAADCIPSNWIQTTSANTSTTRAAHDALPSLPPLFLQPRITTNRDAPSVQLEVCVRACLCSFSATVTGEVVRSDASYVGDPRPP